MMLRSLACVCLALFTGILTAKAQAPSFYYTNYSIGHSPSAANGLEFKEQCLYTAADFPSMPAGRVKAIYIRVANSYTTGTGGPCVMEAFTARIGYVTDSSFGNSYDTFRTGLTTIYGPDTFSFPCIGAAGLWIKIPVTKGNFQYNPEGAKFAVEIAGGPQGTGSSVGFPHIMNSNLSKGNLRLIFAFKRSNKMGSIGYAGMDLGFDLGQPADVAEHSNVSSIGLFPNPSTDGRFNVSLDAEQAIKELSISVTNVTGQRVQQRHYHDVGQSFLNEIDLSASVKGIYFVEIIADGERVTRRVVIH